MNKGITKFITVVLVLLVLLCQFKLNAQIKITDSRGKEVSQELLKNITVSFKEVAISEAVMEIAAKGNFHVNYSESIFAKGTKVTFEKKEAPAFALLKELLSQYKIEIVVLNGNQVILLRQKTDSSTQENKKVTLSGNVIDASNGETLIGANIFVRNTGFGAVSNTYGFYSVTLEPGEYIIRCSYVGYQPKEFLINLTSGERKDILLESSTITSDTITVVSQHENENIVISKIGSLSLLPEKLINIPLMLGEQDILKAIQFLPGITNHREGDAGIYVRGGNADQNLIMIDEATVYSAFHTFGLFSVFNPDAIKNVSIMKGTAPAKFGGRISSVVDMQMNEGNLKKLSGTAGVGLIFSRFTLQGPLIEDKSSFLISARRTYFDLFTRLASGNTLDFHFYDLNAKVNYKFGNNDRLYVSGYFGRDGIGFSDDLQIDWGNATSTVRWNHLFNDKLFLNTSFIYSNYTHDININDENVDKDYLRSTSEVNNITIKEDFQYFHNIFNTFSFGINYNNYSFLPIKLAYQGSTNYSLTIGKKQANELTAYFSHEHIWNDNLKFEYGIRLGLFNITGDKDLYNFKEIESLNVLFHNVEETSYFNVEPRFAATYTLDETSSLKFGYSRTTQNIHQMGNLISGTPLDVWQPSNSVINPQRADQISLGYFKNFAESGFEFSSEAYYKYMSNQIDYKDGANYILKNFFDSELVFGNGWSYGIEFFLKKNSGDLTGWIAYTLSASYRQFDEIDFGKAFKAANDITHSVNLILQYQLSKKWVFSANVIFASGYNLTVPYGKYTMEDISYLAYTERNGYRLPPYHRMDLGLSYTNDVGGTWCFFLYNAYGRKNIYTLLFRDKNNSGGRIEAAKLSLFSMIPSISYTLRF